MEPILLVHGYSTDRENHTWTHTYNADGLVASETDPRGNTTTLDYNDAGRLTRRTDVLGNETTRSLVFGTVRSDLSPPYWGRPAACPDGSEPAP